MLVNVFCWVGDGKCKLDLFKWKLCKVQKIFYIFGSWILVRLTCLKKWYAKSKKYFCFLVINNNGQVVEGYSLDRIKMTEWIWPKSVNMTEKLTTTNVNMVNLTENITFQSCSKVNVRRCVKFRSSSNVKVCCYQFFRSNSNCFLVILIRSSELASSCVLGKGHFVLCLSFLGGLERSLAFCNLLFTPFAITSNILIGILQVVSLFYLFFEKLALILLCLLLIFCIFKTVHCCSLSQVLPALIHA